MDLRFRSWGLSSSEFELSIASSCPPPATGFFQAIDPPVPSAGGGPGCGATSELADKYRAQGRELHVARARAEELAAAAQAQARAAEELRDKISELKVSNRGADLEPLVCSNTPSPRLVAEQ